MHVYRVGGESEIVVPQNSCYLINLFCAGTCVWAEGMLYTIIRPPAKLKTSHATYELQCHDF